jgi:predicted DsbA family dithiol-disulfide isomerase
MNTLNIEIYSDLICPWCYIGKRRMEGGLKLLGKEFTPEIAWRPFQLNPDREFLSLSSTAFLPWQGLKNPRHFSKFFSTP